MSDGNAAEKLLSGALERLENRDVCNDISREKLLTVARQLRAGSMALYEERTEMDPKDWDKKTPKFILDKLFAIDSMVGPPGKRIAFDATVNKSEVSKKLGNHRHFFTKLWPVADLGVVKSAVVLFIPSPKYEGIWGWGLLSEKQKDDLADKVFDILCYEGEEKVKFFEIHF